MSLGWLAAASGDDGVGKRRVACQLEPTRA